jgi:hypothetical protein
VTLRQNTDVWTQGGGGHVSAQHGGWVSAPQIRLRTTEFKEIRLREADGARTTKTVEGNITCVPGDKLSFVYACNDGDYGPLVAIINHSESIYWPYPVRGLIGYQPPKPTVVSMFIAVALVLFGAGLHFSTPVWVGLLVLVAASLACWRGSLELSNIVADAVEAEIKALSSISANKIGPSVGAAVAA